MAEASVRTAFTGKGDGLLLASYPWEMTSKDTMRRATYVISTPINGTNWLNVTEIRF